jgi:hypothetical protein
MKRIILLLISLAFAPEGFAAPPSTPPQNAAPSPAVFRLIFQSYDGDPKQPQNMSFQINTLDRRQPSEFLKIGETIPGTKWKLLKFESKTKKGRDADDVDVSELTVINTETKETAVMVITKVVNLPSARKE